LVNTGLGTNNASGFVSTLRTIDQRNNELKELCEELMLLKLEERLITELERHYPQPRVFKNVEDIIRMDE
jgi:hypothetical protein